MTIEAPNPHRLPIPERLQLAPQATYGTVMFSAGPEFWDPKREHPTGEELKGSISRRYPVDISHQWYIIDAVSTIQRGGALTVTQVETAAWIDSQLVPLFESLRTRGDQEAIDLRDVLTRNFGIDVCHEAGRIDRRSNKEYLTQVGWSWWNKYFKNGSQIGEFVADLTKDREGQDIGDRIQLAHSSYLFNLFGGDETAVLIRDGVLSSHYIRHAKSLLEEHAALMGNSDFSSDIQRHAYEMAWELHNLGVDARDRVTRQEARNNYIRSHQSPHPHAAIEPQPATPTPQREHVQPAPPAPVPTPAESEPPQPQPPQTPTIRDEDRAEASVPRAPDALPIPREAVAEFDMQKGEKIATGFITLNNPEHDPLYSADRSFAKEFAKGEGFVLSEYDGIGTGDRYSELVVKRLKLLTQREVELLTEPPTISDGITFALRVWSQSLPYTEYIKEQARQEGASQLVIDNVGSVGSIGIVCRDASGQKVLLNVNLGNIRTVHFNVENGELTRLTHDQTLPDQLLAAGLIDTEQDAFFHDRHNVVTRSINLKDLTFIVGELERYIQENGTFTSEVITISPLQKGVYLSYSDGITDTAPLQLEKDEVATAVHAARHGEEVDMGILLQTLASRAYDKMIHPDSYTILHNGEPRRYAKPDDIGAGGAYYKGAN